jgi:hypothetical protein
MAEIYAALPDNATYQATPFRDAFDALSNESAETGGDR